MVDTIPMPHRPARGGNGPSTETKPKKKPSAKKVKANRKSGKK